MPVLCLLDTTGLPGCSCLCHYTMHLPRRKGGTTHPSSRKATLPCYLSPSSRTTCTSGIGKNICRGLLHAAPPPPLKKIACKQTSFSDLISPFLFLHILTYRCTMNSVDKKKKKRPKWSGQRGERTTRKISGGVDTKPFSGYVTGVYHIERQLCNRTHLSAMTKNKPCCDNPSTQAE